MAQALFISWSGELSKKVAEEFHKWIPSVIQSIDPFLSSEDIEKGTRWSDQVASKLADSGFGILILTPENLQAPWVLFEAGALSKMVGKSNVAPVLINTQIAQVRAPLTQFQATKFEKDDIYRLLKSLNKSCPHPISEEVLRRSFEALWPSFQQSVDEISSEHKIVVSEDEKESATLDSVSLAIGELIQTVQDLKFQMRRGGNSSIPYGMIKELEGVKSVIEENFDSDGDIFITAPDAGVLKDDIAMIYSFLQKRAAPAPRIKRKGEPDESAE